jgi:predicted MPP superfamily phosphohydrolase
MVERIIKSVNMRKLCHLSDLHTGRKEFEKSIYKMAKSIEENDIDYAVVSGDITDFGSKKQFSIFKDAFHKVWGRLILIAGNHDRLSNDIGSTLMQ